MSQSVRTAVAVGRISAAIVCLPKELCQITADYAVELPHKFTSFETVQAKDIADVETEIVGSAYTSYPWRAMVSTSTFETGHLRWTVDCVWRPGHAWIGVGVTRSSVSHGLGTNTNVFTQIADENCWIVCPHRSVDDGCPYNKSDGAFAVCHNSQFTNQVQADAAGGNRSFRIECVVNPDDASITARINQRLQPVTIVTASTSSKDDGMPDFRTLRPCVVVGGKATAVFRSGS